ncbi:MULTISPECIES: NAD-dependent epimerase/dehydratase family protein [Streptomyces]|uniref:NAD-dependent epimerase/dehydratase family protein n=1 Tax=Streptomyces tendae TaxID=1932 RepID=A0ABW7S471_STRTE|nr:MULTISPECIES: NAD-dependent epimerase/dehydratase family protein [unclassified Streptomyces]MBQ0967264.1 GDP-mannose 4,6-dehydratase [Streptomyces sp. RK74B]MBQ1007808.1 GDP-mannose 4,6-dehydratase [Streptomyces sp. RK23]BET46802.1 GDP-mannose 4,6-dehydratase [Kitasatospora aureofaciens]
MSESPGATGPRSGRAWRRALVTGGAGFVGSHLCGRLLDAGTDVVCLDNLATGSRANVADLERRRGFRFVRGDATDPAALRGLPGRFDLVLHFACPASPADYLRLPLQTLDVGSTGTRNALERAHADGARFLLASTSEVYGDPLEHPQRETYWGNVNPIGPRSVYDESKRFAEALVTAHRRVHGTDTAIVRIFNTYGPRMRTGDGRAVPTFIAQALDGMPLTVAGDGGQTRSLCYVDDTVAGVLALAASGETGPMNIGGDDEITMLELARRIVDLTGSGSRIRFVERPVDDPCRRKPDTTLARERLGWRPSVSWTEGLERTIGWFAHAVAA